ncbi:MAG: hypothetical protein JO363_19645 [Solirubrobacterales bacterium]|nr:hypothetical protein [Solirubrobacterales bacterium]
MVVALEPHGVADLEDEAELLRRFGYQIELLNGDQVRASITSKKFISGMWTLATKAAAGCG